MKQASMVKYYWLALGNGLFGFFANMFLIKTEAYPLFTLTRHSDFAKIQASESNRYCIGGFSALKPEKTAGAYIRLNRLS